MKQNRLDQLADGIFAIVMTLLVFEIQIPEIGGTPTNIKLLLELIKAAPFLLSYIVSFLLLFTYWRGHHYIASVLAENIDNNLTNINAVFFLLVGLVPLSSIFLGLYSTTQIAIIVYGIHIILLSGVLYWMRRYILNASTIHNPEIPPTQLQHGTIRIMLPVFAAGIAIVISFLDTHVSLFLFTAIILFNLSSRSTSWFVRLFPHIFKK